MLTVYSSICLPSVQICLSVDHFGVKWAVGTIRLGKLGFLGYQGSQDMKTWKDWAMALMQYNAFK